jgi:hypothetical protein
MAHCIVPLLRGNSVDFGAKQTLNRIYAYMA